MDKISGTKEKAIIRFEAKLLLNTTIVSYRKKMRKIVSFHNNNIKFC